ncbi:hypothetical protein F5B19DRAFT_162694 [Rostrohypoxylon terebratum]|nr:hypothetical protein F5B19DRAFT_162694 [Rostrohypoxylon terebratum]
MYTLIKTHERSISKRVLKALSTNTLIKVLSSEVFVRRPLEVGSFPMICEMEKRDAHAEGVLGSPFFKQGLSARLASITSRQKDVLHALLKNALAHCDHVADIAANYPCTPVSEAWYNRIKGKYFDARDLPIGFRLKDPFTNFDARDAQRDYLNSLPKEEIAIIYFLITTLSWGWFLENMDLAQADPAFPERQLVFKECILRHGSWFAWGHILGDAAWHRMTSKMQKICMTELVRFEVGDEESPASLHSSLAARFYDFYMPDPPDANKDHKNVLGRVVHDMVTGVKIP